MADKIRQIASAAINAATGVKGKYFSSSKKGENFELKTELNSDQAYRKKEAVKRVIANMTVGKDVSSLFPDVLKCMQTSDIELKKLVYLYLMNYAKSQPEIVILAVNTFCKDTEDPNPLIRALAIRTMGCIRVERILDYLCEPLKRGLNDPNPYVRKTAALAVAKLYDLSPTLAEDHEFLTQLQEMLSDSNPSVVANVIASLCEINEKMPELSVFIINSTNLSRLLASLDDCTEWGQITILDAIAQYQSQNDSETEMVIDKTLSRLQHIHPGVVLSSMKVLLVSLKHFSMKTPTLLHTKLTEYMNSVTKKMIPPLVTLLSSPPEIQYIALRNARLILQLYPTLLQNELHIFFCKYNDPIYVKLEKLHILVMLSSHDNIDQILSELKEYSQEIDIEVVSRSIFAMVDCVSHVPSHVSKCGLILMEFIATEHEHLVQPSIIAMKDLLRTYPEELKAHVPDMFHNVKLVMFDPESLASLLWILGEYCHLIENAPNILLYFIDSFIEEPLQVQYQILTAAVKIYLSMPSFTQEQVFELLKTTTTRCDHADLRDRAFIYWRLLSADPKFAKSMILTAKEPQSRFDELGLMNSSIVNQLISEIPQLSSIYFVPSDQMAQASSVLDITTLQSFNATQRMNTKLGNKIENILDLDFTYDMKYDTNSKAIVPPNIDLLGDDIS